MEDRIKKYVDDLFEGIYITRQLQDMKEEIRVNLLEKINDYITAGDSQNVAFEKAIANLGDMDELLGGLKKASEMKMEAKMYEQMPLPKNHIIGYIVGSALFLIGLVVAGFLVLQEDGWLLAGEIFSGFFILSAGVFTYFGLTQESRETYPMNMKRALSYSLATIMVLVGGALCLFYYLEQMRLTSALIFLAGFGLPAVILFIYLGLSEKSRSKFDVMDAEWQKNWVNKYASAKMQNAYGLVSGALWVFAAAFFLLLLFLGVPFSWLVFVFAVGFQILVEAYFAAKA